MIIDETDYAPRPAEDFWAGMPTTETMEHHTDQLVSLLKGAMSAGDCHQLGVPFSELPHSLP